MIGSIFALSVLLAPAQTLTPEKTVGAFVECLNRRELHQASAYVVGGKSTYAAQRMEEILKPTLRSMALVRLDSMERAQISSDTATVSLRTLGFGLSEVMTEEVRLTKAQDQWKIVPPTLNLEAQQRPVGSWSVACAQPLTMQAALNPVLHQASGAVMKTPSGQAMGTFSGFVMMYGAAYRDYFPKSPEAMQAGLKPFFAGDASQLGLLDESLKSKEGIALRINPNLLGLPRSELKSPSNTVLAYEEYEQQVSFRHDGKALLAFTDGLIRLVSKEESMNILWLPN